MPLLLVTGFLAFEGFAENPSAQLAQQWGGPFELIEVSYAAVDEFLERLDPGRFDLLLLLGVAGKSSRFRIETTARNIIGARADVRGFSRDAQPIEPGGPQSIPGSLLIASCFSEISETRRPSDDAGDFLCNYIFYRAMRKFEGMNKSIGFLHVPPTDKIPLARQQVLLAEIIESIGAR